jgi:hypothetical protein
MTFQDTRAQPNLIVVAFSGTHPFDPVAWQTSVDLSWFELKGAGNVHGGFMKALGLQKDKGWPKEIQQGRNQPQFAYYVVKQRLKDILQENECQVYSNRTQLRWSISDSVCDNSSNTRGGNVVG